MGRQITPYVLKDLVVFYIAAVGTFVITSVGLALFGLILISPAVYIATGVVVTKFVSERVVWDDYIASLHDVAKAKMHTWLTWPVSVPVLLWKIFVIQQT